MIRKRIGIIICFAAIITQAGAQGLNISLNGGLQGTQYQFQNGRTQLLPGGSIELTYSFRLGSSWNLLSGFTGGLYRTQASLPDGIAFMSYQVDDAGSAFLYSIKTTGYEETQQFYAAGIPLLLQYHTTGRGVQWYFIGGGKALIPFSSSITVSAKQLALSGYYPDFNIEVTDLPQHGFGTITNWRTSATTNLKPTAALSAATGVSFSLSRGTRLYAGVYAEYGLTDLKGKKDSMPLVSYSSTGITAVEAGSVLSRPNTGSVTLLSFGFQLRLGFGSSRPEVAARRHARKVPQQLIDSAVRVNLYEIIERSIVFGLINETALPDIQQEHLDEVADLMKQYPSIRISLVGHICNDETKTEDKKVGRERARAVAEYLESKGIDPQRIDISPVVESDVFAPDDPPANYRHRRVVVAVE
jgi:outer membrane protein OmpA-like peptidoglycan-associated protein